MSLAHILSQESQLSQYYEEEREKLERKQIMSKSKEPVDPQILHKGLQHLGITSDGARHAYLKLDISGHDLLSINVSDEDDVKGSGNVQTLAGGQSGMQSANHAQAVRGAPTPVQPQRRLQPAAQDVRLRVPPCLMHSPPANLQIVDYSHNQITKIEGAHKHKYLRTLILDSNQITRIEGLAKNPCLTVLCCFAIR
jgi:hypothetical protein